MLSAELVFRLITNLAGGQRPAAVYNGAAPIEGYFCRLHDGDILKPVLAVEGGPLPVPAVWQTVQCIRMLPGLTVDLVSHGSVRDLVVPAISAGMCSPSNAILTSTTTTCGFQTTTSTSPTARPFRPLQGLQSQDVVFHIMGRNGAVAHCVQKGRGHTAEILYRMLACLHENSALTPGCVLTVCPRVCFDDFSRPHVFITARGTGENRYLWLFTHFSDASPFAIDWNPQLEMDDVLDQVCMRGRPAIISVNGVVRRQHPASVASGHLILVAPEAQHHFTMPLHILEERCVGIQSLLFRARGPDAVQLASTISLRTFCHELVGRASCILGSDTAGCRVLIVGMHVPPLVCCVGTALPPSALQVQEYYDAHLRAHFGPMSLADTACVHYDLCYFAQRQQAVDRRLWIWPLEGGYNRRELLHSRLFMSL